jgi:MtrB/PioB family decaheme-associated outer membrane protein
MKRIVFALALASSSLFPVAAMAQETAAQEPESSAPGEAAQEPESSAPAESTAEAAQDSATEVAQGSDTGPTEPFTTNEVSLGALWVSGENTGLFGRYNGLTYEGLDLIGSFVLSHRDPGDSGRTFYYEIRGTDLLLQTGRRLRDDFRDSRFRDRTNNFFLPESAIGLRVGNQGLWDIDAGYQAITYTGNIINSIFTVNGTTATLNNGLAPWGGASNAPLQRGTVTSFTTTQLLQAEREFQTGTRRDIFHLGGKYRIGDWTIASSIRHEHKQGTLEQSLRLNYAGQAFTQPVDYDTDRFDISAAYNTRQLQAVAQFTYMKFNNDNRAVTIPWAVSIAALTPTSGPFAQSALYSLPPDNSALYLTGMLGYNFAPRTRLTLNGRIGLELQNDTFPANTAAPNLSNTLGNPTFHWFDNLNSRNQGTVHNSPRARAFVYQGNLSIDSSLTDNLDGRLSYVFDGRHVRLREFMVWGGGSSADALATRARFVVPQNWFKQTAKAEATYHLRRASNTKLILGYSFQDIHRTNAQVRNSTTHTGSAQLSSMLGKTVMGRLTYEHADRSGRLVYGYPWGNFEFGEPEEHGTPSGAYYQAPMNSDSVTARLDWAPQGKLSGGLFLKYIDERFHYPEVEIGGPPGTWNLTGRGMGIVRDYNLTVGPDISYRPSDKLNFHLYYTYQRIFFDNRGNGACATSNTGNCAGSAGFWQNKYTSSVHTAGIDAEWHATPKLKFLADYTMSFGSVLFGQFNGVMVPTPTLSYQNVVDYPDIDSRFYDLNLSADYRIARNVELALLFRFSKFHNNDWNNLAAPVQATTDTGTTIAILTPGYPPPRYKVFVLGTAFRVRF